MTPRFKLERVMFYENDAKTAQDAIANSGLDQCESVEGNTLHIIKLNSIQPPILCFCYKYEGELRQLVIEESNSFFPPVVFNHLIQRSTENEIAPDTIISGLPSRFTNFFAFLQGVIARHIGVSLIGKLRLQQL